MDTNEILFYVEYSFRVSTEFKDFILNHDLSIENIDFRYDEDNGIVTLSACTSHYGQ